MLHFHNFPRLLKDYLSLQIFLLMFPNKILIGFCVKYRCYQGLNLH